MSLKFKKQSTRNFLVIFLFLLILILTPFLLILTILLLLIRILLNCFKILLKPNLGNFLTGVNNVFSTDWPYENPSVVISFYAFVRGQLNVDNVRNLTDNCFKDFAIEQPKPIFQEMTQFLTTWMGFSVWQKEENFDMGDHVQKFNLDDINSRLELRTDGFWRLEDEIIDHDNAANLAFVLTKVPFRQKKSPWEILIHHKVKVENEVGPCSLLLMRLHHTLGDGLALFNVFSKLTGNSEYFSKFSEKCVNKVTVRRNWLEKLWYNISYPFLGVLELLKIVINTWDDNKWHNDTTKVKSDFNYTALNILSKDLINDIRRRHGHVKFFTILVAALTGGLKKFMIRHGVSVPDAMHCLVSVSIPKEPTKLSNNICSAIYKFPTGLNNRCQIVQVIEEESIYFKTSRYPLTTLIEYNLIGLLPRKLIKSSWVFTTLAGTNFPGFDFQAELTGLPLIDARFVTSLNATTGIYFWAFGYMGNLGLCLGASKDIMPTMIDLLEWKKFVQEEFQALQNPQNRIIIP